MFDIPKLSNQKLTNNNFIELLEALWMPYSDAEAKKVAQKLLSVFPEDHPFWSENLDNYCSTSETKINSNGIFVFKSTLPHAGFSLKNEVRTVGFIEFIPYSQYTRDHNEIDLDESVFNFTTFIKASQYVHNKQQQIVFQKQLLQKWAINENKSLNQFINDYKIIWTGKTQ